MKTIYAFILCLNTAFLSAQTESDKYRIIDKDSTANIIFSSQKITVGGEDAVTLKNAFILGENIWGRAYFPKKFSDYKTESRDSFCIFLYIDDRLIKRITQEPPEAEWGQMQIWLSGTDNDYFPEFETEIRSSGTGEHNVTILIGIERFTGTRDVPFPDGTVEKELMYSMQVISKGNITLIVQ